MRLSVAAVVRLSRAERFRILLLLGLIFGATGAALWPLFFLGAISVHSATAHARLMTKGFVAYYVAGVLGTADRG